MKSTSTIFSKKNDVSTSVIGVCCIGGEGRVRVGFVNPGLTPRVWGKGEPMKPHVLVVDDCLTVRMDLRGALSAAGFEVTLCDTKRAAITMLEQCQFAAVLLDVVLPDGDGISILSEIRNHERTAHLPVILLSNEAKVRDRVRGLSMGADEYVGKPYDVGYLIRRLRALCQRDALGATSNLATGGHRILAVDDSPTFLAQFARNLREDGHDVVIARSGHEALAMLAAQSVDCIVLDVHMPSPNGLETLKQIRQTPGRETTPILMISISEDPTDERNARDAGADDFVIKYVAFEQIRARIRRLLRRQRDEPAPAEMKRSHTPVSVARSFTPQRGNKAITPQEEPATNRHEQPIAQPVEAPANASVPPITPAQSNAYSPIFLGVAMTMGLSADSARDGLARVLRRMNIEPQRMNSMDLSRIVPMLHDILCMSVPADEANRRAQALAGMITRSVRRTPQPG
jgi:DNA-binding response OmpR family regulator